MEDDSLAPASTLRYSRKRDAIVSAATHILNQRGLKGVTLADVAASVGLITTSVTYYFKKKEDLAAACYLAGISQINSMVDEALLAPTPESRLRRFIDCYLEANAAMRLNERPPIPSFSDIRALNPPHLQVISGAYSGLFRKVRSLFWDGGTLASRRAANAKTLMLIRQVLWSVIWLPRYEIEDYQRIRERLSDIIVNGLAPDGARWVPHPLTLPSDPPMTGSRDIFLVAATRLINAHGYRGASVEKISAELNVTKGSFYHHNDAKDDLVAACFERTFEVVRQVQSAAMRLEGTCWDQLSSAAAGLVEYQLSASGPLLRASAMSFLPTTLRQRVVESSNRLADRFSGMISDGIAEGSIRPVEVVIAGQALNITLNAAADLGAWVEGMEPSEAASLYARPMLMGVLRN